MPEFGPFIWNCMHHTVYSSDMNTTGLQNEKEVIRRAGIDRVKKFLSSHTCYDLMKPSGKVGSLVLAV